MYFILACIWHSGNIQQRERQRNEKKRKEEKLYDNAKRFIFNSYTFSRFYPIFFLSFSPYIALRIIIFSNNDFSLGRFLLTAKHINQEIVFKAQCGMGCFWNAFLRTADIIQTRGFRFGILLQTSFPWVFFIFTHCLLINLSTCTIGCRLQMTIVYSSNTFLISKTKPYYFQNVIFLNSTEISLHLR